MKRHRRYCFLSVFLMSVLTLPGSALALRPTIEGGTETGLEEALTPAVSENPATPRAYGQKGPVAGLEESTERYFWDSFKREVEKAASGISKQLDETAWQRLRREGDDRDKLSEILSKVRPNSLRTRALRAVPGVVLWFQNYLDPTSPHFDIKNWVSDFEEDMIKTIATVKGESKPLITGSDLEREIDDSIRPIQGDFIFPYPIDGEEPIKMHHLASLYEQVLAQVLAPRGVFYIKVPPSQIMPGRTERIEPQYVSPAGRWVPVYAFTLDPKVAEEVLPGARAYSNLIIIPKVESQERRFEEDFQRAQSWWKELEPHLGSDSLHINIQGRENDPEYLLLPGSIIRGYTYGSGSLEGAREVRRKELLSEEGPHSDTLSFIYQVMGGVHSVEGEPQTILPILKDRLVRKDSYLWNQLDQIQSQSAADLAEEAMGVIELEAWLLSLQTAPVPLEVLRSKLSGGTSTLFPTEAREPLGYKKAHEHFVFLLGSRLFSDRTESDLTDAKVWFDFLLQNLPYPKFQRMNERLRLLAGEVYREQFLTLKERKADQPLPWGSVPLAPSAGLEEKSTGRVKVGSLPNGREVFWALYDPEDLSFLSGNIFVEDIRVGRFHASLKNNSMHISRIDISLESNRGKGVGTVIANKLLEEGFHRGARQVTLLISNPRLLRILEHSPYLMKASVSDKDSRIDSSPLPLEKFYEQYDVGNSSRWPAKYGSVRWAVEGQIVVPTPAKTAPSSAGLEEIQGFYAFRDIPSVPVLLFDQPATWRWSVPTAKAGAPTAVVVDEASTVIGLEELFQKAGVPGSRYAVAALETFSGNKEEALEALRAHFGPGTQFQMVPPTGLEEMKRFLEEQGVLFYTDIGAGLEEIQDLINSRA